MSTRSPHARDDSASWTDELVARFDMMVHPEGGYFVETDRSHLRVPNVLEQSPTTSGGTRTTSTTIYYLLTSTRASGYFHRNKSRTVHCLHEGKGVYVLLYPSDHQPRTRCTAHIERTTRGLYRKRLLASGWTLEIFEVGSDVGIYQWLVEGDIYKCSFLRGLDTETGELGRASAAADGLFISEVVSPGFEFTDHNFMSREDFTNALGSEQVAYQALLNPRESSSG